MASLSNKVFNPNWVAGGPRIQRDTTSPSSSSPIREPTIADITALLQSATAAASSAGVLPSLDTFPSFEGWGLLVSVEGVDFDYEFTREDLQKVFQRYGRLSGVDTLSPQYPFGRVWFKSRHDADAAIRDLDQKVLNGIHGRLRVVWDEYSVKKLQEVGPTSPSLASGIPPSSPPSVRKYTCRFDIGIENDKEFQVARRIIGQKGCNMKKIVDASGAKLRLRGKGSGYLEGPLKQESPEPLHLCVSCQSQAGYNAAVKAVSEILEGVYDEYRKFRRTRKGHHDQEPDLKVALRETPLGGDRGASTPERDYDYPSSPEPPGLTLPDRRYDSGYWKVPS